jgi:very-short-patch-repair endonuclease
MTTRHSPFGAEPFRMSDGLDAGLGRGALNGPQFEKPFHGVRAWSGEPAAAQQGADARHSPDELRLRAFKKRCRQFATRMSDLDFFSHGTALILRGAPTPADWDEAIHVSGIRPRNPARSKGVASHRLAPRAAAFRLVGGLRVEQPVRAWVQASHHLSDVELIVAADHLVASRRRLATIEELRAEAAHMRGLRLQVLLDRVREGSESSRETKLRLELVDAGLPEPELAYELYAPSGTFIARLDGAYPAFRVAVEYDGRQHAENPAQFARDADRWREIGDAGWQLVRVLNRHFDPDPALAVDLVRRALLRAGWRP